MPRSRQHIYQVHIADGFADDCEELIHKCLTFDVLTYEVFCEIWKDMQFGYLYHGRTSGTEIAELTEELLYMAKHYMVGNTSNFEENVAGLFLVYGLLNLQPYPKFASLRVVPEDIPAINRIDMCARRHKRYDVLYILGSVLIEGPVQFHAIARERGMDAGIKKYLEWYTGIDKQGVRPKGVFYRQNEELDLIRELHCITRRYNDAKTAISGENSRNLNFVNVNLASELDESLKRILNGKIDSEADPAAESDERSADNSVNVHSIKERAMKTSVEGVKFLQTVHDPNSSPRKLKNKGELKEFPSKSSPKKMASRMRNIMRADKKRRFGSCSSASSTGEEEDSDIDTDFSYDSGEDLNLDVFDMEKVRAGDAEIDIDVDSLPRMIKDEREGKAIEIEFIDEFADPLKLKEGKGKAKTAKKLDDAGEGTSGTPRCTKGKKKKIDEFLLKKREKRDLKKTILKSKFKRMGMLNIANFDEIKRARVLKEESDK